ncbi:hypothetical protein Nmel_008248 [Mimus melanotis]
MDNMRSIYYLSKLLRHLLNAPSVSSVCHKYRLKNSQHLNAPFLLNPHPFILHSERVEKALLQHFGAWTGASAEQGCGPGLCEMLSLPHLSSMNS